MTIAGQNMRIPPESATQNWETVEAPSYRAFLETVPERGVVYDIGAHIGTYAVLGMKKAGPQGRSLAFEPHEYTRRLLERTIAWNNVEGQILIRGCCCGAVSGMADFFGSPNEAVGVSGFMEIDGLERKTVAVTTIDEEVAHSGLIPDVIKIDVEGAEFDVLKGATNTLATRRPCLVLSLHTEALAKQELSKETILKWLDLLGYESKIVDEDHEIHVVARAKR